MIKEIEFGLFYFWPPPTVPSKSKEPKFWGSQFGLALNIPIKIKEPESCGFHLDPVIDSPSSVKSFIVKSIFCVRHFFWFAVV